MSDDFFPQMDYVKFYVPSAHSDISPKKMSILEKTEKMSADEYRAWVRAQFASFEEEAVAARQHLNSAAVRSADRFIETARRQYNSMRAMLQSGDAGHRRSARAFFKRLDRAAMSSGMLTREFCRAHGIGR